MAILYRECTTMQQIKGILAICQEGRDPGSGGVLQHRISEGRRILRDPQQYGDLTVDVKFAESGRAFRKWLEVGKEPRVLSILKCRLESRVVPGIGMEMQDQVCSGYGWQGQILRTRG